MTDPNYSRISSLAVVSGGLGVMAIAGLLVPECAVISLAGIGCGIAALRAIRQYELGGRALARMGVALSVVFAALTPVWHVTQFQSESLAGYERIEFATLATSADQGLDHRVGQKVCLKGYASWGRLIETTEFELSSSGSNLKSETFVMVELVPGQTWTMHFEAIAVSGVLVPNPAVSTEPNSPKYLLRQSTIRDSKTRFGLVPRAPYEGC